MSYSRWSNSAWYTYWNASSGKSIDTQVLTVHYSMDQRWSYIYGDSVDDFLFDVAEDIRNNNEIAEVKLDELVELRGYIQLFNQDVEEEFGIKRDQMLKSPYGQIMLDIRMIHSVNKNYPIRPKAIRDDIDGASERAVHLDDEDFRQYIEMKVIEEFAEYLENRDMNEFCDLLDVIERIQFLNNWSDDDIDNRRREKRERKGVFWRNLVLFEE